MIQHICEINNVTEGCGKIDLYLTEVLNFTKYLRTKKISCCKNYMH